MPRELVGTKDPTGTMVETTSFTDPRMLCVGHRYVCPKTFATAAWRLSKFREPA